MTAWNRGDRFQDETAGKEPGGNAEFLLNRKRVGAGLEPAPTAFGNQAEKGPGRLAPQLVMTRVRVADSR
jgi:hypothetical protein